jgi:hypothetical protein
LTVRFHPLSIAHTTNKHKRHLILLKLRFCAKKTDWEAEETEAAGGSGTTQHLWEESWDDDDTSDDFSAQLKYVFSKEISAAPGRICTPR